MRAYRVVRELQHNVPYIVQGDTADYGVWADISRFHSPDDARRYVAEVLGRQRALTERPARLPLPEL